MKRNKKAWFKKVRGSYLPSSVTGLTIYLIYTGYVVALFADWYWNGHHVWYLLTAVVPLSVGAALITQYIAAKHAR